MLIWCKTYLHFYFTYHCLFLQIGYFYLLWLLELEEQELESLSHIYMGQT